MGSFHLDIGRAFRNAAIAICLACSPAAAADVDIDPAIQQTPVWCWAATAEMVLKHYGVGNLNQFGNYQCGVVGSIGGSCWSNCGSCVSAIGSMSRLREVLGNYVSVARYYGVYNGPDLSPRLFGRLSLSTLEDYIEGGSPIIAGISPTGAYFPDGVGLSQHVVVIVGADSDTGEIVVNDPYPYGPYDDPYIAYGGSKIQSGQYAISYSDFRRLNYQNSMVFE
jgi:hypothetical protein